MEVFIYRVMQEFAHESVDMDMCPVTEYERTTAGEFLSKKEAIRLAQRIFARTSANWVTVSKDKITDKGRIYGKRVYNLYRGK